MCTGEVHFGGRKGTAECGLVEVEFGGGEGTAECGLVRYSLGEERGRLNVDWCGTVWGRKGDD